MFLYYVITWAKLQTGDFSLEDPTSVCYNFNEIQFMSTSVVHSGKTPNLGFTYDAKLALWIIDHKVL